MFTVCPPAAVVPEDPLLVDVFELELLQAASTTAATAATATTRQGVRVA
jgi:hypothetical protein